MEHTGSGSAQRIGKYEILGVLGEGAMGVVYRARDPEIGRIVAIKTPRPGMMNVYGDLSTLQNEARAAGNLRHPHIVTIFDIFTLHNLPHIVMEYVEGDPLDYILEDKGKLAPAHTISLLAKLADALDYAHSQRVLHCDIKPANVLITSNGEPLILDFGIAGALGAGRKEGSPVMGTPSYMSPEQILGQTLDGRADTFSLAVVAFECFSGSTPFAAEDYQRTLSNILTGNRFALGTLVPALPLALDAEFERALAVDPNDRFQAGKEMIAAFAGACGLPSPYRQTPLVSGKNASEALSAMKGLAGAAASLTTSQKLSHPQRSSDSGNDLISYSRPPSGQQRSRSEALFSEVQSIQKAKNLRRLTVLCGFLAILLGAYIVTELFRDQAGTSAVVALETVVEAPDVKVRVGAESRERPLAQHADQEVLDLIQDVRSDESTKIGALREVAMRPIPQFIGLASDIFPRNGYRVRIEVVKTLGALQEPSTLPTLAQGLVDRDAAVRKEAAVVLGEFRHEDAERLLRERIIREREEFVVQAIRYSLTRLRSDLQKKHDSSTLEMRQ
jgi:serine/threonine protein kinase